MTSTGKEVEGEGDCKKGVKTWMDEMMLKGRGWGLG